MWSAEDGQEVGSEYGMPAYQDFASVYDLFMEDVPYDAWCSCLTGMLQSEEIAEGLVCELGCGTGSMTERLARAGYDMIGIDLSEEMLGVAQRKELLRRHPELADEDAAARDREERAAAGDEKTDRNAITESQPDQTPEGRKDILYLQQDMRSFELYGTVRAIVSVCDSLNYILEEEELLQVFRLVNNYLDPGGLFLFDVNTPACYAAIGDQTIAENRPEGSFIWENSYDPETQLNEYDLTLFLPAEENGLSAEEKAQSAGEKIFPAEEKVLSAEENISCGSGRKTGVSKAADKGQAEVLYIKREETHIQRGYTAETVCSLLEEAGLSVISVTEAYTGRQADEGTERLLFAAREVQKKV